MAKDLPINPRIVQQLAKATVKDLFDAIVELVTNSDDSYRRLEEKGDHVSGEIVIHVVRQMGSVCKRLMVQDFAEGMSCDELERAIEYGSETSGIQEGRSVRGLFGRGLKETIISLGEGTIKTVKNGKVCMTRIWLDAERKRPLYDDELCRKTQSSRERNGTKIDITVTNERISIPEYKTFYRRISRHYALRDILTSSNRCVKLVFEDKTKRLTHQSRITFKPPEGIKRVDQEIRLPGFGDRVKVTVYESPEQLDSPKNSPSGLAGILIKTRSAVLDNQLFGFEKEPAALHFFGEAICYDLEERLRKGQTELIDANRGGLEWRHDYCGALSEKIEEILEPLIEEKRRQLEKRPEKPVKESTKKLLHKLCSELSRLAEEELEDETVAPGEPEPEISRLLIKPEAANLQVGKAREFSIYAPAELVSCYGQEVIIRSDCADIRPLASKVCLEKYGKFPERIWYRYFKVVGYREGAEGHITASLSSQSASAKVRVGPAKKRKKGELIGQKGKFVSDIIPDELENPPQRVVYKDGVIRIYIKFPCVAKFIGSGLDGVETPEGKVMLAELVGEAFCKELARRGIDNGKYPTVPGQEIDSFNATVTELQKKYLLRIHEIISAWNPK